MQKFSIALALLTAMGAVHANDEAIKRCRQLADTGPRLACYDAIALGAQPAPRAAAAPAPVAAAPVAAAPAPAVATPEEFGLAKSSAPQVKQLEVIESALLVEIDGWNAGEVIKLANGQKWQVVDASGGDLSSKANKVRIRRGMFGGFFMEFDGSNLSPRVKRIQ